MRIIQSQEVAQMIQAADRRVGPLIALAWITGARLRELCGLETKDIDIDEQNSEMRLRLRTMKVKDHPSRELAISLDTPFVADLIIPRIPIEGRLFPLSRRYYQLMLEESNKRTQLWFTFHEFRHSRLTFLARNLRASLSELMDWTGWITPEQVGTYVIKESPRRFKDKIK